MLKKPTKTEEVTETVETTPEVQFTNVAYSLVKDGAGWHVVKIPFDFKTLQVGTPVKMSEGEVKGLAMERFRIEAGRMMMQDQNG